MHISLVVSKILVFLESFISTVFYNLSASPSHRLWDLMRMNIWTLFSPCPTHPVNHLQTQVESQCFWHPSIWKLMLWDYCNPQDRGIIYEASGRHLIYCPSMRTPIFQFLSHLKTKKWREFIYPLCCYNNYFSHYIYLSSYLFVCLFLCMFVSCVHTMVYLQKSMCSLQDWILFLHHVGPGNHTWVIRLWQQVELILLRF